MNERVNEVAGQPDSHGKRNDRIAHGRLTNGRRGARRWPLGQNHRAQEGERQHRAWVNSNHSMERTCDRMHKLSIGNARLPHKDGIRNTGRHRVQVVSIPVSTLDHGVDVCAAVVDAARAASAEPTTAMRLAPENSAASSQRGNFYARLMAPGSHDRPRQVGRVCIDLRNRWRAAVRWRQQQLGEYNQTCY